MGGLRRSAPIRHIALSNKGEETFDVVEPRGLGRREVNVPTRTACEPSSDLGMLVGGAVITSKQSTQSVF